MPKLVTLTCETCHKSFIRRLTEHTRNVKKGRRVYCSLSCAGAQSHQHLREYVDDNKYNLRPGNKLDEFSPFRSHLRNAKERAKKANKEFSITLQDLKNIWEKQNGKCPYTGWSLVNPESTSAYQCGNNHTIYLASLDRIDSNKGYTSENIQFVCLIAQFAKNSFTNEELVEFCRAVARNSI